MAAKRITQETFDEVVQENITEFGMDPEESVNEAIQQFESQGMTCSLNENCSLYRTYVYLCNSQEIEILCIFPHCQLCA